MGRVKIRHYRVKKGRAYWEPSRTAKRFGFSAVRLGAEGPQAWREAERLNELLDAARIAGKNTAKVYAPGTLGAVFDVYRESGAWREKEARTKEEWYEAWEVIEPVFGDIQVACITPIPDCDKFYDALKENFSLHKTHKIFKIFRAMLTIAVHMKLIPSNPSLVRENTAPRGRDQIWSEAEAYLLADSAWDLEYFGLSIAIRIAYDTQFSPVDVRRLALSQLSSDTHGRYFDTNRKKTKKKALGTISKRTEEAIEEYLRTIDITIPKEQPFIRNRSGRAYSKDTLGDDFRFVRGKLFPNDDRTLSDMRRTGSVEAVAGEATPSMLSAKSGNTIGQSSKLHDTYVPTKLAVVRSTDVARALGRKRLREQNG
jgi:hypothetical protein